MKKIDLCNLLVTLTLFLSFGLNVADCAPLESHFKKIEKSKKCQTIRNVDFVYLINLDRRPEKLAHSLEQLAPYGVVPYRFPAIYGLQLPKTVLDDVGVRLDSGMILNDWALTPASKGTLEYDYLRESCYGMTFFSQWMEIGAIGCALSHLSVIQDAYDSGYHTVWVLEDDIVVRKDPHIISDLIDKLDHLLGEDGWDVFFTNYRPPKLENYWWLWRPDFITHDYSIYGERTVISDDFIKIGERPEAHSLIIRRSGMKKILDHAKKNKLYVPYDHEIAFGDEIKLYMLSYQVVEGVHEVTDIHDW